MDYLLGKRRNWWIRSKELEPDEDPKLKQDVLELYRVYSGDPAQLLNIRVEKQTEEQLNYHESRNHIKTKALDNAEDVLREKKFVFVVGDTGSGKTVILNQLAVSLKNEYRSVEIKSAAAFTSLLDTNKNQLFIVDDIFGKTHVEDLQNWLKLEEKVSLAKNNGAMFVVSCRTQLYKEAQSRNKEEAFMKRLKECCIYLNDEDHQLNKDKIAMLRQHIERGNNPNSAKDLLLKDDMLSHAAEISCTCFSFAASKLGSADHVTQLRRDDVPPSYNKKFLVDFFNSVQNSCGHWKRKLDVIESEESSEEMPETKKQKRDFDLSKCQEELRRWYRDPNMTQVKVTPWDPSVTWHIDDVYMRLSWVKQTETPRGTTEEPLEHYSDMFQPTQHQAKPLRILVQGEAGVGKSTFTQRLAVDWAKGSVEVLKGFDLLLVIRLREVYPVINFTDALYTCMAFDEKAEAEKLFHYVRQNQEKCLILFDGLDEYDTSQKSEILEIIEGQKLKKCCVILTTRPSVVERVKRHCRAICKIRGFDKKGIEQYASKFFSNEEEAKKFVDYLEWCKLCSLAETPLLCLFLCLLWKDKESEVLPTTKTALYQEIIQCIIDHSGSRSNSQVCMTLKECDEVLRKIGKVAYEALKKDSLLFDLKELAELKQTDEVMSLGLLSTTSALSRKAQNIVSFLHKSLQEFAAAWFVAKSLEENDPAAYKLLDNLNFVKPTFQFESVQFTLCHSEIMVNFICGLSAQAACKIFKRLCVLKEKFNQKEIIDFCDFWSLEDASVYRNCLAVFKECGYNRDVSPLFVNFLDGSLAVDGSEISENKIKLYEQLFNDGLTKLLICGYTCSNPQQSCLMSLFQKLGLQLLPSAVNNSQCVGTSALEFLSRLLELSKSRPVTVGLLKLDTNLFLECYDFPVEDLNPEQMTVFSEYPQGLRILKVDGNIETVNLVPFDKHINVRTLRIERTELTLENVRRLSSGLCAMKHLKVLKLSQTGLTGHSVKTLCENLKCVTQLQKLDLSENNQVGDEGVISVAEHLGDVPHLRILHLSATGMTASGVRSLSAALHHTPHLEELVLSCNPLCDGVVSLAGHLSSVPQLGSLLLSDTQMTGAGVRAFAAALRHVRLLVWLDLSFNNCVDSDSWITLAGELHHLGQLYYLDLENCGTSGTAAEQSLRNAVPRWCHLVLFD